MIKWFFNLLARFSLYSTQWVEDLPDNPCQKTVYIIGGRKHPFYAAIVCPRKACQQVIHLDLSSGVTKGWSIVEHPDGRISISPSIHVTKLPCQCHYWLRRGRIVWSEAPRFFVPEVNRRD